LVVQKQNKIEREESYDSEDEENSDSEDDFKMWRI
jgi:hypothetical protein